MKLSERLCILLVILSTVAVSFGQAIDLKIFDKYVWDKTQVLADAGSLGAADYPNADTVVVCDHTVDYYQPDGAYVSWMDTYEKVLTEKGKRSKQTIALSYNEAYSSCTVPTLEIIKADGTAIVIDVAANGKVMIDRSQMSANIYDPAEKILQIGLPGVEIGDMIHMVAATNNHKPRAKGIWCGFQTFESDAPIRDFVYEVHEPKDLPLQLVQIKDPIEGTVTFTTRQENGRKVYRWEVKDVPQIFVEPSMPAYYTVTQRLLLSTSPDWKAVSRWYYGLCEPYLSPSDEMKAKVAELVADCTTRPEKIQAVFKFVSQDIRYLGIIPEGEDEAPGYQPHYVSNTFANRHGVCRDKASLLVAMLRLADLQAFPVLINAGPKMDMEVPLPYFNHAITAVLNDDGSYMLMDSTDENTKDLFPGYLCDKSYLVARPEGETLQVSPIVPAAENLMLVDTTGKITAQGKLEANCHLQFNGINDNVYRGFFARSTPQERRQFFESLVKGIVAGATLSDCQILPADMMNTALPLDVVLSFTADNVLIGQGDTIMVPTISMDRGVGMANFVLRSTGLDKRRFPLQTRYACGVRQTLDIDLDPAIGQVLSVPQYDSIDDEIISLEHNFAIADGKLVGSGTFLIKVTEISPEQYLTLKDHLRTMEYNDRKMTIFAKPSAESTADVVYNNIERTYELSDASNWTETVTVKKQVKTYAGKKDHGDLKLNYNEGWETVELVYARVTTGEAVKEISADEINRMDASWVASAPRYPGSKTLVASLPGVEVGSTIEYQYRTTIKDVPFFATTEIFASQDPIKHMKVTVRMPANLNHRLLVDDNGIMEPDVASAAGSINQTTITEGGFLIYTFEASNLVLIPRETNTPPSYSFAPAMMLSTGNWKEYAKTIQTKLTDAASGQKRSQDQAKSITVGLKSRSAKAIAIRDYVSRNIRRVGPGLGAITNTAITAADTTLADGYGNSTDNAIVLYAMAKVAGLSPEFVLACRSSQVEPLRRSQLEYSGALLFGTVLVQVRTDNGEVYLNDTNQYDQLGVTGYDDSPVLPLAKGRITELDLDDELENRSFQEYTITIAADGSAALAISSSIQGESFGARKRMFAEMIPENRDRYIQQLVASVSQSAKLSSGLETIYSSYPGIERFSVRVDKYAVCDADTIYFDIPNALAVLGLSTDEHKSPYYISGPLESEVRINIELPSGYTNILMAPESHIWQLPDGAGVLTMNVSSDDSGHMTIVETVKVNDAVVNPDNYPELLEINRQLTHKNMEMILIKR